MTSPAMSGPAMSGPAMSGAAGTAAAEQADAVVLGARFGGAEAADPVALEGLGVPGGGRGAGPAAQLPAHAGGDEPSVLGSGPGTLRDVQRLAFLPLRFGGVQRAGRRLPDPRERAAAQGRALVRPG